MKKEKESEEVKKKDEIIQSGSLHAKREKRAIVRESLREARSKLKELQKEMSLGKDYADDVVSCKGEIELLFKELESIEDGGHATFLEAKELIAPKKNVSEKKLAIRSKMEKAKKEISELEKKLYFPTLEQQERDQIIISISKENTALEELKDELNALKEFNHTRFVLTRDENKKIAEQQQELENIESKVAEIKNSLMEANSKGDAQLIEELQNHLNSLDQRKSELLPDEIDPFLEVKNSENLNNQ
jgi:chromosome segregation ATPase